MSAFSSRRGKERAKDESAYILDKHSPWPVQEAYRALRTNIEFSLPEQDHKIIGVTSAQQHDGKSTVTINTAIAFGEIGEKVLLIECDLRLPVIGARLGIKSVPGLADVLVGRAQVSDALHVQTRRNLDVIGGGTIPPDPTWLLQSRQMETLITGLAPHYDYVFIDTPPITTVADAMIVSKYTEGFLLVVRDQQTDERAVAESLDQLRFGSAKVLGFVYYGTKQAGGHYYKGGGYYK